jgi:hypothetical protein
LPPRISGSVAKGSHAPIPGFAVIALAITLGLPRFQGQVDRGHAMTTRLSIDELTHQDQASIHGAAKGGGC